MKIKKIIKTVSIALLFCMMIMELSSVATVMADERNAKAAERKWMQDAGAGLVDWAGQYKELDENTVPKAVGYENAKWKNHIERLYEEEGKDLNRVVFKNADGTRTQYVFDYPVKYKDKYGKIKDSSLKIKEKSSGKYKFETEAGVSTAMFPKSMQEGIVLEGNDTQIRMVLHNVKSDHPKRLDEETISYKYDAHTTVEYSLTYTGFKEDIVVHKYTGQTEYDFTVYTGGLELKEVDGSFYFVDENGKEKATIGDIIIFTADEKNNILGALRAVEVVKNQEYRLTIVLDPEYLASPETAYPIRIDPTIEITYDNNGAGAIEDVTINSLAGSSGTSKSLSVGLREKYGISRILMKFPGLDLDSLGSNVDITSATVEIRDLLCEGTYLDVSCYVFAGNTWTESTANWSSVSPNSISTFLSSQTISYYNGVNLSPKHRYSFDITEAVRAWQAGTCNQNKGIIFKANSSLENGSSYECRTIASYNRSSNKPSLSLTYSEAGYYTGLEEDFYYLNNKNTGKYLKYSSSAVSGASGFIADLTMSIRWKIQKVSGGYVIRSMYDNTKYLAVPTSTSSTLTEVVTIKDGTVPQRCIWRFSPANGGGYLIQNLYNSRYIASVGSAIGTYGTLGASGTSTYNATVWRLAKVSDYGTTNAYPLRELTSDCVFDPVTCYSGDKVYPALYPGMNNSLWSSISDFTYSVNRSGKVSFNTTTGVGTAQNRGYVTVTATHKVTGMEKNFEVYVKNTRVTLEESKEIKERFAELIDSDYPYLIVYNVNTVVESLDIIFEYDELITAYCNTYRIPKEFVQSVLFRELWCYNVLDDIADASVFAYYEWKRGMMPRQDLVREDCSTGLAQIFARTAIKALNNAKRRGLIRLEEEYETESWEDMCEVWYGLHYNDEYNLSCCALVILDCQYEFAQKIPADFATMNTNLIQNGGEAFWVITPEEDFWDYDEKQIKMILARYNGVNEDAMQYGNICYEYYNIFKDYN